MKISTRAHFETVGRRRPRVWLLCNICRRRLQRLANEEEVDVTHAYFCRKHDPGYRVDSSTLPLTDQDIDE